MSCSWLLHHPTIGLSRAETTICHLRYTWQCNPPKFYASFYTSSSELIPHLTCPWPNSRSHLMCLHTHCSPALCSQAIDVAVQLLLSQVRYTEMHLIYRHTYVSLYDDRKCYTCLDNLWVKAQCRAVEHVQNSESSSGLTMYIQAKIAWLSTAFSRC